MVGLGFPHLVQAKLALFWGYHMLRILATIRLLAASNTLMTFAWYWHT